VLADWKTAPVPDRTRAALRLLEAMTLRPREIDPALVRSLQATGIDDTALRGVANSGFHYNLINRVADAFDFERPEGVARERLAHALDLASRLVKGPAARVPFVVGADGVRRPEEVEAGRIRLLSAPGLTNPDLRRAVDGFVAQRWGVTRADAGPVAEGLQPYLTKLATAAYKITDDDLAGLRAAGLVDEAIYELTIVGAMSAALIGLEAVYEARWGN
jgi:alkylhydroperoxidase family enzyme